MTNNRIEEIKKKISSRDISQEEYLGLEFISSSRIRTYESTPEIFYGKTLDEIKEIEQSVPTPSMKFGTLIHKAILEPEEYEDQKEDLIKDMKSKSQEALIPLVMENIYKNSLLSHFLGKGKLFTEKTFVFGIDVHDPNSDKKKTAICKARIDLITNNGCLIDIKTTRSPLSKSSAVRTINQYRYDLQLAFYKTAAVLNNIDIKQVGILFIEKTAPYGNHLFFLDDDFQDRGEVSDYPIRGFRTIMREMIFNPRKDRFDGEEYSVIGLDDGWRG